jgi:hypothetical protein
MPSLKRRSVTLNRVRPTIFATSTSFAVPSIRSSPRLQRLRALVPNGLIPNFLRLAATAKRVRPSNWAIYESGREPSSSLSTTRQGLSFQVALSGAIPSRSRRSATPA